MLLRRLFQHLSRHRRWQCGGVLALLLLTSLAEVASIGAVLPFLAVLVAPENVWDLAGAQPIIHVLQLTHPRQLLWPITLAFILAAVAAGGLRIALLACNTHLAFATGADLGQAIVLRTLHQPYTVHASRHSSEVIDGVTSKTHLVIIGVLLPLVQALAGATMLLAILAALLWWQPGLALGLLAVLAVLYSTIMRASRARLQANSRLIAANASQRLKTLQESLGAIRDVLLDGSQAWFLQAYREADNRQRLAQARNAVLGQAPRFMLEALGVALLASVALWLALKPGGLGSAVPILGGLALGAQRLLPMVQQCYLGWANLRGNRQVLAVVLDLLDQPAPTTLPAPAPLPFEHTIAFDNVAFRYQDNQPWILQGVHLSIRRGQCIGIVGVTGGGKSTLLDLLMGLLPSTAGTLRIDGQPIGPHNLAAWQRHVAHVPQAIFLADASVAENIAFGQPRHAIDLARVGWAAAQAELGDTISAWPQGYDTQVGERGVRLSGGQRQRLGLARALYKRADILVLDEATNALDTATEGAIIENLHRLDQQPTIFMVAHRLSTLDGCDGILEVREGRVLWQRQPG